MQTATMNDVDVREGIPTETENETDDLGKEEQKSRFFHLRAKGLGYAKMAKELKVSTSTLSNWNQELLEEIAQAKAVELEALQEEYLMLKEGGIKLLGGQLKTIQEEISGRDLSKVSTERLMELQLRYFGELKTEYVATELRDRLDTAELNIRLFLAVRAILDAAAEAVGLDIPGKGGVLASPYMRLGAFIALYNIRLEELNDECKSRKSDETRLEKALKMLPAIDPQKLRPSPASMKQLKSEILKDAHGEEWLRTKVRSLEYDDGFNFKDLVKE